MAGNSPQPRKPPAMAWVISIGALLLGAFSLGSCALRSVTAEDELTLIEGIPEHGTVEKPRDQREGSSAGHILRFSIEGKRIEYSSDRPAYDAILKAVTKEDPLQVWVSTKEKKIFASDDKLVPLYKMKHNGRTILAYGDTVAFRDDETAFMLKVGGVVAILGAVALGGVIWGYLSYRRRLRIISLMSDPSGQG